MYLPDNRRGMCQDDRIGSDDEVWWVVGVLCLWYFSIVLLSQVDGVNIHDQALINLDTLVLSSCYRVFMDILE